MSDTTSNLTPPDEPAYTTFGGIDTSLSVGFPDTGIDPEIAYRLVHDERILDGNARLNLATFVTTWMEPQAEKLMQEAFATNSIDKDEYPSTSAMEQRCVRMIADLFHAEDALNNPVGVSTIGSSEAVMLAGLALKWRWRARMEADGKDASKPELVLGTNVQVVWEKFCRYFDVVPRYLPLIDGNTKVQPSQLAAAVNENTIGVVGLLGTTFTGEFEDIAGMAQALDEIAAQGGPDVPLHVDAASGGFVAPFINPDLEWDFRVKRVVSINVSGHKYGMTYPGIGFAVWRSAEHLPDDLVFHVDYLGGDIPTFTLNFSRPGNQIVGQYYVLIRLGREGFKNAIGALSRTAQWIAGKLGEIEELSIVSDGSELPVLTVEMSGDYPFDVYDISHELRAYGWQVPAYPLPENEQARHVLRVVVREGFSGELAQDFVSDCQRVVERLRNSTGGMGSGERTFAH